MTHLEQLIQDLCPNGVKRYKLKEIAELKRGVVISKDYINEHAGEYPVYSSQTENNGCLGYIDTYAYDGTYLTWTTDGANAGTVFYREGKFNITNVCGLVIVTNPQISVKYLYYILSITAPKYVNRGMGNPKLMSNVMQELQIPLPPLAVQSEIVRILDEFTLYKSELAAELAARLQQYEYYRDKLLTFDDTVKRVKLGEVFELRNGYTPSRNNHAFWDGGTIPWYRMEDIRKNGRILSDSIQHITPAAIKGKGLFKKDSFILATTATIGEHALLIADSLANQRFTNLQIRKSLKDSLLTKFVFYYMYVVDEFCKNHTNKSGFDSVDMKALVNMPFPLPPLSEQERIVSILDRFDKLCHDIREGLPAEIDLRQKQYEHYRDKLLTFEARG